MATHHLLPSTCYKQQLQQAWRNTGVSPHPHSKVRIITPILELETEAQRLSNVPKVTAQTGSQYPIQVCVTPRLRLPSPPPAAVTNMSLPSEAADSQGPAMNIPP